MEEKIKRILYYPMLVSDSGTEEEIPEEIEDEKWKKFKMLSEERRNILISEELPLKIMEMQDRYKLADSMVGAISLLIRKLFFGEINLAKMEENIKMVAGNTNNGADNKEVLIFQFIKNNILTIKPDLSPKDDIDEVGEKKEEEKIRTGQLSMEEALQKYPKVGEQLITTNLIKLRIFPTPVRPSIKNWITDYHDFVGSGTHNSVDRGNYIFQSVNGKSLTPMERERVSNMLKIVDQNENVSVDMEKEMIVFAAAPIEAPKTSAAKGDAYVTKMHSSSGPKMQNESAQKPDSTSGEQEDVFDRYAKKSFSPNFANKQDFVVSKRNDMQKSVEQFRNAAPAVEETPVFHGSEDFHDFSSVIKKEKEDETEDQVSFSTPQVFSAERRVEAPRKPEPPVQQPAPKPVSQPSLHIEPKPMSQPQPAPEQKHTEEVKRTAATYRQSWHIAPSSFDSSDSDNKM